MGILTQIKKNIMTRFFKELLNSQCDVLTEIQITKNYDLFGILKGNRNTSENHIKKIRQSLRKKHIKEVSIVVVCNPTPYDGRPPFLIIDGQHRFKALKEEGLPVTFVVVDDISYNDEWNVLSVVELLNTSSMEWDVTDFMGSKCELGNENYLRYSKIYEKFSFEHEIIYYAIKKLGGFVNHDIFKKGLLKFDEEIYNDLYKTLEWLEMFLPVVSNYGKRYYLKALLDLYFLEDINLDRLNSILLNKNAGENGDLLQYSGSVRQSLNHLALDLYNVKLRKNLIGITSLDRLGNKYKLEIVQ
jgi:hypothetical protein